MNIPNVNDLPNHLYSVYKQEVADGITKATIYEQTCIEFGIYPVWERASTQAQLVWDQLRDELATKGYTMTFHLLSGGIARTRISWG